MNKDSLGDRMKRYESAQTHYLTPRTPVIVRVDGNAFHTWTRGFWKPYDERIYGSMISSMVQVSHDMQGCKLSYTQSDEVSFLLTDTDTMETQPWFGYVSAKVVSLSSSLFTGVFNRLMARKMTEDIPIANFDARAFNIPESDVANYFLWRVKDCQRNSVSGLAQKHFSPKLLHGKNRNDMLDMLRSEGVEWSDMNDHCKLGTFYLPLHKEKIDGVLADYIDVEKVITESLTRSAV